MMRRSLAIAGDIRVHRVRDLCQTEKLSHLSDELPPRWGPLEQQMISTFKRNEARPRNRGRQQASFLEGHSGFVFTVQNQGWNSYLRQQILHINVSHFIQESHRIF